MKQRQRRGREREARDEGAKRDGAAGAAEQRVKVGRNSGIKKEAETEKGDGETRDEGPKRDGAAAVVEERVKLGRNRGPVLEAEAEKRERRGMKGPNEMDQLVRERRGLRWGETWGLRRKQRQRKGRDRRWMKVPK